MARVFISYASGDRPFVEKEVDSLIKHLGFETWFAPANIRSAELWEQSIAMGLEGSDWFMLIVSSESAASAWVKKELNWALEHLPDRIIPFVIDGTDSGLIDERVRSIQHLDYGTDRTEAVHRLIKRLVDAQYKGFQRHLGGKWVCAVQPVYYARPRCYSKQRAVDRWKRALRSLWNSAEGEWHIQDVQITPSLSGYMVDTVPAARKLQWRWTASLVANAFLVGPWTSKRKSSGHMAI